MMRSAMRLPVFSGRVMRLLNSQLTMMTSGDTTRATRNTLRTLLWMMLEYTASRMPTPMDAMGSPQ